MNTKRDPTEIAETILHRSICSIKVGACIADSWGVFAWGPNHMGPDGLGLCAERFAISRSKKSRLYKSTIYVAGEYRRGKFVPARPCEKCRKVIDKYNMVIKWRDRTGEWRTE